MDKKLVYRPGSADDLEQIKNLAIAAYSQYSTVLTPENWEILNTYLHNEQSLAELITKAASFVCTDTDMAVGMAFLIPRGNPTDIYEAGWCYIRMVGVHPDYTGQGIARKLTKMCIEKARDLHETTIALHTSEFMDAARHIYESLGFKVLKELPPRLGKRYWLYTLNIS